MKVTTPINKLLNIDFPMIMAPMFLVSNEKMMKAGIDGGVKSTFPTLNYRSEEELAKTIQNLHKYKEGKPGNFGVNLIAQKRKNKMLFWKMVHFTECFHFAQISLSHLENV